MLNDVKRVNGHRQVTSPELKFALQWLLDESLNKELRTNWKDAYMEVEPSAIAKDDNVISSHIIHKVNEGDDRMPIMKARLVLHGNRDRDRFSFRRDSAFADLSIVRLLISLPMVLDFKIATADVKGAYMQSGPIKRKLYVRPPKSVAGRDMLWKLLRLPYGIVEAAGRQWLCVIEQWLTEEYGLTRIQAVNQLLYKQGRDGGIDLYVAKIVDDSIVPGASLAIDPFFTALDSRFKWGQMSKGNHLKYLGCIIHTGDSGNVILSITDYSDRIDDPKILESRRTHLLDTVDAPETHTY